MTRENPYRVTKPLAAELAGLRSGYGGVAFRILVRIDDDTHVVYVQRLAHCADVYRSQ